MVTQVSDDDLVLFYIFTSNLLKMEMQLSSQSCPMDIREPVVSLMKNVGRMRFGRNFIGHFQGGLKIWFDEVAVGHLHCRTGRGAHDVGAVW